MTRGTEQPTDEDLVAAVLAGDRERFGDLIDRYQGRLVNYLFRLLRNADDAHDLAQEVLVKVYQVLDRYDPQYKFSTWLFRVAQNAAIDQIRRRRLKVVSLRQEDEEGEGRDWDLPSPERGPVWRAAQPGAGRSDPGSDRVPPLGVPGADPAAPLRRASLRGDRQDQGDAPGDGQEQALPRAADAQGEAPGLSERLNLRGGESRRDKGYEQAGSQHVPRMVGPGCRWPARG